MEPVECGCEVLREAEAIDHAGNRQQKADYGRSLQQRLACPVITGEFPKERPSNMDARTHRALDQVERLTEAAPLTCCPKAYARREEACVAMTYRNRRENKWLAETTSGQLPNRLVRGIDLIDYAHSTRLTAEQAANKPKT